MSEQLDYVKGIDLFGTKTRQVPSLSGEGAPSEKTVGEVGEFYLDTKGKKTYLV